MVGWLVGWLAVLVVGWLAVLFVCLFVGWLGPAGRDAWFHPERLELRWCATLAPSRTPSQRARGKKPTNPRLDPLSSALQWVFSFHSALFESMDLTLDWGMNLWPLRK